MKRLKMTTVISASIPIRVEIEPDGNSGKAAQAAVTAVVEELKKGEKE